MGFETPEQRHLLHISTRAEEDASSMKKNKASSVVIGGHPAGLMLSVIRSVE
jgi:hypothetical protein